ncbi:hypothetical protein EMCRGX_G007008 [Ephydatia muelleri]
MPFHIVHIDVVSLQCERACEFSDVTAVKMPFHIVHTDVVSLQYDMSEHYDVDVPSYYAKGSSKSISTPQQTKSMLVWGSQDQAQPHTKQSVDDDEDLMNADTQLDNASEQELSQSVLNKKVRNNT